MTNNNEAIKAMKKLKDKCGHVLVDKYEDDWKAVEASLQPPKGYVLVPEEVTLDMYKAGQTVITQDYHSMQCEEVYKAMIQAGRKDDDR
ncbi:MAG: hypothetical protein HRT94_09905 [Alphaproteobacteria bacterium]|nr:hypothetical protein [Alphaproteobacteria bacterium]